MKASVQPVVGGRMSCEDIICLSTSSVPFVFMRLPGVAGREDEVPPFSVDEHGFIEATGRET